MFQIVQTAFAQNSGDAAAASLFGGLFIGIWAFAMIFGLLTLIVWVWALVDCLKREFPNNEKTTWIIVLIVSFVIGLGLIGAIVYFIVGKKNGTISGKTISPAPAKSAEEKKENKK